MLETYFSRNVFNDGIDEDVGVECVLVIGKGMDRVLKSTARRVCNIYMIEESNQEVKVEAQIKRLR